MNLSNASNFDLEAGAEVWRDGQFDDYINDGGYAEQEAPTLAEFISKFTENGSFTTPKGTVDTSDLMEDIDFTFRQNAHDAIQMEALKGDPETTMATAAQNWFKLVNLMNAAAADYYKTDIVGDYK